MEIVVKSISEQFGLKGATLVEGEKGERQTSLYLGPALGKYSDQQVKDAFGAAVLAFDADHTRIILKRAAFFDVVHEHLNSMTPR